MKHRSTGSFPKTNFPEGSGMRLGKDAPLRCATASCFGSTGEGEEG